MGNRELRIADCGLRNFFSFRIPIGSWLFPIASWLLAIGYCLLPIILWNCETIAQEKPNEEPTQRSVSVEFDTRVISLSLKESILFAIRNNFDVEIARLNPEIGNQDITIEKSKFDPTLKVDSNVAEDERPTVGIFITGLPGVIATRTDTDIFTSTIEKLFETGGKLSLGYGFNYRRDVFPTAGIVYGDFAKRYTSFVEAKLTQPILKGGWFFYNLSPIYIARNNKQISVFQFKNTIIQTVDQVQKAYWDLVKAIEDLRVARKSLERAKDLLEKNKLQVEAGMLTPIDVLEAEAGVASREEAVISAENEIKNKEDILKKVINLSDSSILSDASIAPIDKPIFDAKKADMPESIKLALQNRPDLLETQKKVENAEIVSKQRKNELLPQLDIKGNFRYDGLGRDLGESNDLLTDMDFESKGIGLTLEIPIGLRSARSNYTKAKLQALQSGLDVKKTEQKVVVDVRTAVRQINTNIERVYSTRKARELADKKLDAEGKKFNVGKTTSLEVLRAQEDLAIAEGNETKAVIDYQVSLGDLDVVTATALEKNDIHLKD